MTKDKEFTVYMEERGFDRELVKSFLENLSFFMEGEAVNNYLETMGEEWEELEAKKNDIEEERDNLKSGSLDMIADIKAWCDSFIENDDMMNPAEVKEEIEKLKYEYIL